jgi:O-antigen/teichoic acid export membrane protein
LIVKIIRDIKSVERSKLYFIIINVFIAILRFVRSFVFMKYLSFTELGTITIIMTIIGFFGMFQFGFLNGGYRIFSVEKDLTRKSEVNNIIYTYFLILFFVLSMVAIIVYNFNSSLEISFVILISSVFFGLITLINNWIRNILSAYMNFKELNSLELIATSISLLGLITIPYIGFNGAFLSILSQPFIFLIISFIRYHYIRPTKIYFNLKMARWILAFGFVPFLSGIFVMLNNQIEKWSILYYLDTAALGKFYLPALYHSLFILIPFSIGKLFFPPAMQKFVNKDLKSLKKLLINYSLILIVFIIIAFITTYFLLEPIVARVFPEHLIGIKYVWDIFPGLVAILLVEPLSYIFYASVKLRPIFWASFSSTFILILLIIISNIIFGFNLSIMAYIKSIIAIYVTLVLYIIFFVRKQYFLTISEKI